MLADSECDKTPLKREEAAGWGGVHVLAIVAIPGGGIAVRLPLVRSESLDMPIQIGENVSITIRVVSIMRLSTKNRYAARALSELGSVEDDAPLSVREISERQHISAKYLEQICQSLCSAGLLNVIRGKRGGFLLAKPPEEITLRQVCEAIEGSLAPVDCVDDPDRCPRADVCPTRDTWVEVARAIRGVLERTTVQQLVERKRAKAASAALDYQI